MVIDTSVLFDALVPGALTGRARAALASIESPIGPDILEIEIAGALTRGVRRGLLDPSYVIVARAAATRLVPTLVPTKDVLDHAVRLSLDLVHPLFDCLFLALAEMRATRLVTGDGRFAEKLKHTVHAASILHLADWQA